ncbi:MAG: TonB family protein [Lewinellaceae bacterium]|nr:TonB family protein [Lewinellaceae bacterium]
MKNPSVQHDDARFLDLLRRWQSGDFTRADELELTSLTNSDDFRREAMEGFMSLPAEDHEYRLLSLRQKVQLRSGAITETARRVMLFRVWAAAAALALLVSAIWFLPTWTSDQQSPVAAVQEAPAGENTPSQTAPSPGEAEIKTNGDVPEAARPAPSVSGPVARLADHLAKTSTEPAIPVETADLAVAMQAEQNDQVLAEEPAPSSASSSTEQSISEEDKASQFVVSKPQPDAANGAQAAKDLSKAKKSLPARARDSIWHQTDVKPEMDAAKKEAREENQPAISEPGGGWDAFNEYLRQNARLPLDARNNNVSGTVRLQFVVNANGEPQNFITLRSLGYGCDEEAIRLVKNWEWVRGKSAFVTVEVRFVR